MIFIDIIGFGSWGEWMNESESFMYRKRDCLEDSTDNVESRYCEGPHIEHGMLLKFYIVSQFYETTLLGAFLRLAKHQVSAIMGPF